MNNENENKGRQSFSLKERFAYWFDNQMAKGSLALIHVLIAASVAFAIMMAGIIVMLGLHGDGDGTSVFWNSIATVINAWMPYSDEGSTGYLIMMSVIAIAGVLFTSVLIGIITSAIEEKIDDLKKGNSFVLEKEHFVVLGFYPGEYTLIEQLILAAAGKPLCIVVAEDMDRGEMEEYIRDNVDIPKTTRIVCRTVDITNPVSIEKCSVETCRTVIISPTEDARTTKSILAVSALLQEKNAEGVNINAIISKPEHRFPTSIAEAHNIATLQTNNILAKMIAHSCTQTGLSQTFRETFNYEGSEFYLIDVPGVEGRTFGDLMVCLNYAVPAGVFRDGKIKLNPPADYSLQNEDRILVFAESSDSAKLEELPESEFQADGKVAEVRQEAPTDALIFGRNETLPLILKELPENVSRVLMAGAEITEKEWERLQNIASGSGIELERCECDTHSEEELYELARKTEHIVILNEHDKDQEDADMDAIFLLLNLRDIRTRYHLSYNITMEMQKEHNQNLVGQGDHTDFLVATSMSSLFLAQFAENPELRDVFREILSNEGNELYLKKASDLRLTGRHSIRELRWKLLARRYILIGYLDNNKNSTFNMPLDEVLTLEGEDSLIVLGEE
ncbi:MAG: hypothetical protein IJT43_01910 [Stomatobaculum sp.]|nr:hypothetical protein [Stomatobaculum sp.]